MKLLQREGFKILNFKFFTWGLDSLPEMPMSVSPFITEGLFRIARADLTPGETINYRRIMKRFVDSNQQADFSFQEHVGLTCFSFTFRLRYAPVHISEGFSFFHKAFLFTN